MDPAALFLALPKAELHLHLEGCVEPELYLSLAHRNGMTVRYTSVEELKERLRDMRNFGTFLEIYEEFLSVMCTARDFEEVALSYLHRVQAHHVVYVEMFFDPQLPLERGVTLNVLFEGLVAAQTQAEQRWGMKVRYIMCFNRDRTAESALALLEESAPWKERIIGVGLDHAEELNFPEKFEAVFKRAHEMGYRLTSHCGIKQPNTIAHFWGCLENLHVERIDHGLDVLDDPGLIETVRGKKIGLTACPTLFSHHQPGWMEFCALSIRRMLELGLLVNINSDDPALMRSGYLGSIFPLLQEVVPLTCDEVVTLVRNSFLIAWLSTAERESYLTQIDAELGRLMGKN